MLKVEFVCGLGSIADGGGTGVMKLNVQV